MEWRFATTLIGSLPYADPVKAVDRILDGGITFPSWPQLPARGYRESMYVQTGLRLPGVVFSEEEQKITVDLGGYDPTDAYTAILSDDVDHFENPRECNAGLYELMDRDLSGFPAVKGQVTGPVSEGLQVQDLTGRSVIYDESYCEIVRKTVNMTARWQARELSERNPNVILFFDEPSLTLLGSPFASVSPEDAVRWMNESMEGIGCHRAVHCCGNTDWGMVLSTDLDILSFDAYGYGRTLALFPSELSSFLDRGGVVSWGIVPNSDGTDVSAEALADMLESQIGLLEAKGIDGDKVAEQSMITPQCGLGGAEESTADRVIALTGQVSELMRSRYGFD